MKKKKKRNVCKMIEIYTDGCCKSNPGIGGYGIYILYENGKEEKYCKRYEYTTNNQMELLAVVESLRLINKMTNPDEKKQKKYTIYTDSQYVYKGILIWLKMWKTKNWMNSKNELIANINLWKEIDRISHSCSFFHNIEFKWVKGHSGNRGNEIADTLANEAVYCQTKENEIKWKDMKEIVSSVLN